MAHTLYDNFVLANKVEDFLSTNVDLMNYLNQVDADGGVVKGNTIWQKILKFIGDLFDINIRPVATICPPSRPPSGPRSMSQSAALTTSRLCSITMTVLPLSTSF